MVTWSRPAGSWQPRAAEGLRSLGEQQVLAGFVLSIVPAGCGAGSAARTGSLGKGDDLRGLSLSLSPAFVTRDVLSKSHADLAKKLAQSGLRRPSLPAAGARGSPRAVPPVPPSAAQPRGPGPDRRERGRGDGVPSRGPGRGTGKCEGSDGAALAHLCLSPSL